jgi:hypothetical protein
MLLATFLGHHSAAPNPLPHKASTAVAHVQLDAYVTGQARADQPRIYRLRLGDGMPTVAARFSVTVTELDALNPWLANHVNDMPVGQVVIVPPAGWSPNRGETTPNRGGNTPPAQPSTPDASRGWVPVPGMPDAFSRCVEMRESSDNPRSVNAIPGYIGNGGGLFGDLESTWADYGGYAQPFDAPVSVQVAFNARLFAEDGKIPWLADKCNLDGTVG